MSAAPFSAFSPRHLNVATCRHAANHAGPTQHTDGRSLRVRHDQDAQYSVVATERLGSHRRCFCLALPKQHRNRATLTSRRGYARPRRVNVKLLPQGERKAVNGPMRQLASRTRNPRKAIALWRRPWVLRRVDRAPLAGHGRGTPCLLHAHVDRARILAFCAVHNHPQRGMAGDDLPSEPCERVLDRRDDFANRLDAVRLVWDDTRRWLDDGRHFG